MSVPRNIPIHPEPALVLLSGGFDSVAALAWAQWRHATVRALTFHYGQPHRDAEDCAAGRASRSFGVPWDRVSLADTLRPIVGSSGLLCRVEDHDERAGVNAAFVPGRNMVFLASALAHAMGFWPDALELSLVVGFCREDAAGFPDCSEAFVDSAARTLTHAAGRKVHVRSPWVRMPKAGIWNAIGEAAWPALEESWSCYRGERTPCGTCTACVLRARAFAGHADRCVPPEITGGDVHRDRGLG